jgi:hypothetical protein
MSRGMKSIKKYMRSKNIFYFLKIGVIGKHGRKYIRDNGKTPKKLFLKK